MPVFYGTDRGRQQLGASTVYGAERARRLELGRALVTVPKAHQIPNLERPWVYRLPFTQIVLHSEPEDPRQHFTLKDVRPLSKEEFLQLVQERLKGSSDYKDHALVFVHGFNTSFEYALYRTAQIAYDIKFDGVPLLYSWPSMGSLTLHDYSHDREEFGPGRTLFARISTSWSPATPVPSQSASLRTAWAISCCCRRCSI